MSAHRFFITWAAAFFLCLSFSATNDLYAVTVKSIDIKGHHLSSDRLFYRNLRTRVGEAYSPLVLNEDIKRLYELGKFDKIKEEVKVIEEDVFITLLIEEKPQIRQLRYIGMVDLSSSAFSENLKSEIGGRLDQGVVLSDMEAIRLAYRENGHLFAKISHRVEKLASGDVDLIFVISENGEVKIGDIILTGNDHVPSKRLKKLMETSIDRLFSKGVYDADVFALDMKKMESYYRSLGYLDAKVHEGYSYFSEDQQWLYLEVVVTEGSLYVIDEIELSGHNVLSEEFLSSRFTTKVGSPYTDYVRLELADAVESAYGEIGRVFTVARVEITMSERAPHVKVAIGIQEGEEVYLRDVKIEGNNKTREVVVRRELEFYPGERINTTLIDRSKRNLANLGFFSINDVDYIPTEDSKYADVLVRVEEKDTGSINFALGFSSVESIFGQIKYTQRNFDWRNREKGASSFFSGDGFIGDGQNLSVSINTGSETRRFNIDFSEPWVFNRKIRFGFGLYHTESSIAEDYDETMEGFYTRIGKEFMRDLEGFMTLGFQNINISDIDANVSQVIKDEEGTTRVSFLKNEWVYEGRDNRFFPTSGWYFRPEITFATQYLGGREEFVKFEFESKNHQLVFDFGDQREHVLSHRFKVGYVEPYGKSSRVGIFERFFAGGMGSVRGFGNRSLGPRSNGDEVGGRLMTVYNLEYSIPINERSIRGVFFSDTGNVYARLEDFEFSELRTSIGFGLRLQIPALGPMPLALDFAKPINSQDGDETETFSFNFGNFF